MKLGLCFITFIFVVNSVFSQNVIVLDKTFSIPIPGVKVYSLGNNDTLQTNVDGEVNINSFPINASIIFTYQPYFKNSRFKKDELAKNHNVVYLERSSALLALTPSRITAKEYSEDLPFFVDILNLDDNSTLETDEGNSGGKVSVISERGISVFRSLEPKKMLLVLDGIRLDDEIYTNGKVESLLNFDKVIIGRIQQIYGPSFIIYSPEASGGIIEYFTQMPISNSKKSFKLDYNGKYISSSNSTLNNLNFTYIGNVFSSYSSFSYGDYGNIVMGKNRKGVPLADSLYGLRTSYVTRVQDSDYVLQNSDPFRQIGTDYQQMYLFQKFRFKINSRVNLFFNFHYINTSQVGIYSGLTEINFDHYRFAVCEFEPQKKYIATINLLFNTNRPLYDFVSLNTSFSTYNEYRRTRKLRNPVELNQIEDLKVFNFNADFVKLYSVNRMVYGISYQFNNLKSTAIFKNIETDSSWQGLNRYPTNGSFSHKATVYWGFKILSSVFEFNFGLRNDFKYLSANFDNTSPQIDLTFNQKEYFSNSPAASFGFTAFIFKWLQSSLILSASTHAPILDDFAKVMVKNFVVAIPTDNLKQEKSLNSELGLNISPSENIKFYGSAFLSRTYDAIVLKDTLLRGEDSIYFGTDRYILATHVNIPNSIIYGYSSGFYFKYFFDTKDKKGLRLNGSINYVKGINLSNNLPLPNISPIFGNVSAQFRYNSFSVRLNTQFNGIKKLDELSPVGEDYIEKASSVGFLPWQVYNAKLSIDIKESARISLKINNIFDQFYNRYSTAIVAPGRTYIFSVKFSVK